MAIFWRNFLCATKSLILCNCLAVDVQLPNSGCATFHLPHGSVVFIDGTSTPKLPPPSEMFKFVFCPDQMPSSSCATFHPPVIVLSLFAASTNYLAVAVQLWILSPPTVYQWCATIPHTSWMCNFLASSRKHLSSGMCNFSAPFICNFYYPHEYVTFHYPHEYEIFTIQLSLLVRCATLYVATANCLADFVQLLFCPRHLKMHIHK